MKTKKQPAHFTPQNPRFPGIVAAARELGVTRHHLYFVLKGERVSPRLLLRFYALAQKKGAAK